MNLSSNDKVNDFLADIQFTSPEQFDLMMAIRELFLNANQDLDEGIKYGGLVFNVSDTLVGGIFAYKKHISIEFSNGVNFTDSNSILEGRGKQRRHLKIHSKQDIIQKKCAYFVKQAV